MEVEKVWHGRHAQSVLILGCHKMLHYAAGLGHFLELGLCRTFEASLLVWDVL